MNPCGDRLADVLPDRLEVGEFLLLSADAESGDDGDALDLESAALGEADPAAELARLRTRRFVRGWQRSFDTADHCVLYAAVFVFTSTRDAVLSCEDHAHSLVAAGAHRRGQLLVVERPSERAVVWVGSVGASELLVQLVGPGAANEPVDDLAARARARLSAMASNRGSS